MNTKPTADQAKAACDLMVTVLQSVKAAGRLAEGPLYATLMGHMDMDGFAAMVRTLVNTGLVRQENHQLVWAGGVA